MRKTILIPTDFSVQSLNVLKSILSANSSQIKFDIILMHGFNLSDSIMDLLFYSKYQQINALTSSEFNEACEVIKNKYDSQISSLKIDLFSGYTISSFNNYIEINKIEEVFTSNKELHFTNKNSFSMARFIKKCKITTTTINALSGFGYPEKGKVAEVFNQISIG